MANKNGLFDVGTFDTARFDSVYYDESVNSDDENVVWTYWFFKLFEETSSALDVISKRIETSFEDETSSADDFVRVANLFRELNDAISSDDSIIKQNTKLLEDSVLGNEEFLKDLSVFLNDAIGLFDDVMFTQMVYFEDSVGVIDRESCINRVSGVIATIQKDLKDVLFDIMNEQCFLVKEEAVMENNFVEDLDRDVICVQCRIVPISQKDRNMIPLGSITTGSMTGYFLPEYNYENQVYEVKQNDVIEDRKNDVSYRVIKIIQREHLNTKVVYIKALLQRI